MRNNRILTACLSLMLILAANTMAHSSNPPDDEARVAWLRENAIPVRSIDFNDTDFSDLQPLKEKIGDSRVVMIGEQTHAIGENYLMKGRLIRFLHEEMGFNILAWESGMLECRAVDSALLDANVSAYDAFCIGVFSVFAWAEQVQPLFNYLKAKRGNKIHVKQAGFDFQFSGKDSELLFVDEVDLFFDKVSPGLLSQDLIEEMTPILQRMERFIETEADLRRLVEIADQLLGLYRSNKKEIKEVYSKRMRAFWRKVLKNFKHLARFRLNAYFDWQLFPDMGNLRDEVMGKTIVFLVKKFFPKDKIIIWAASSHNARNLQLFGWPQSNIRMGEWAYRKLKDEIYSIAPICYEGEARDVFGGRQATIEPAIQGSISWYLHELGGDYYFLDLKSLPEGHWLRDSQTDRVLGADWYLELSWPMVFDAFFYIKKVGPCTRYIPD